MTLEVTGTADETRITSPAEQEGSMLITGLAREKETMLDHDEFWALDRHASAAIAVSHE